MLLLQGMSDIFLDLLFVDGTSLACGCNLLGETALEGGFCIGVSGEASSFCLNGNDNTGDNDKNWLGEQ